MAPNDIERRQDASAAAASAPTTNTTLYLAIGIGVGVAIILAITGVAVRIVIKKKQHQRRLAEMEQGAASAAISPSRNMEQLPRLITGVRCSQMMPHSQQGWDALASNETLNEPGAVANPNPKRLRSSVSLPKKFRNRGIQFGRNKYLSAIVELESPISEKTSPELPQHETMEQLLALSSLGSVDRTSANHTDEYDHNSTTETAARTTSPKPDVLPSFAIRSGAAIANDDSRRSQAARSVSVGVLADPMVDDAVFGLVERSPYRLRRPELHGRSLSLGAPTSQPPAGPVPPLPIISPHRLITDFDNEDDTRQGVCISRMSSSSIDSASSSVLVTSPILSRNDDKDALHSPTLEDVVAEDEHASLKAVSNRHWSNPRVNGPRPNVSVPTSKVQKSGSVRGSIIRFSSDSLLTRNPSSGSTSSQDSIRKKRLSVAQLGTANSISMSRVSSTNSLHGSVGGVQKIITPTRKNKRQSSVSANGSPAERKRVSVLRDISGNANNKFSANRESSDSTLNSGRSSCGNPFQWDPSAATLAVPSALKGSPNARKGHRRQNCVRISTLTPQVLGPAARSRSASPANLMDRIKEERESDEFHRNEGCQEDEVQLTVQKRRPTSTHQSSNSALPGSLRVQTLRASLTPDSPTLSAWNAYEHAGVAFTVSDSNLSVSPDGSRANSRQSNRSSGPFVIPKFPTPSKARASVAATNHDAPLPEFSMDFANDNDDQSPFALGSSLSSDNSSPISPIEMELPSSPPLQTSAKKEYDPAWPMINLPMPDAAGHEYDPASPPSIMLDVANPERSSWFLPFAAANMVDGEKEGDHPMSSIPKEDSPPCSPKSSPQDVEATPRAVCQPKEALTSSNASSMMSRIPSISSQGALGLSSIPILLPPTTSGDPVYQLPEWKPPAVPTHASAPRPRRVSSTGSPSRVRRRSPEPFLPTIPQSSSPPQSPAFQQSVRPLNLPAADKANPQTLGDGPKGPRNAPAKSVLNNVSALRRMNSEYNTGTPNRQSRNWQRLGREASPLLPWAGGVLGTEESSNSLFDFDFSSRTSEQYTQGGAAEGDHGGERESAMDEIDAESFDRILDGALAGFDAEFKRWSGGQGKEDPSEREEKRASSVWDDGEQFWEKQGKVSETPSYKIHPAEVTPRRSAEATCDPRLLSTSPGQMGIQMSSPIAMGNTPKSLYDADGFLKT